jgi:hypothetical protein
MRNFPVANGQPYRNHSKNLACLGLRQSCDKPL